MIKTSKFRHFLPSGTLTSCCAVWNQEKETVKHGHALIQMPTIGVQQVGIIQPGSTINVGKWRQQEAETVISCLHFHRSPLPRWNASFPCLLSFQTSPSESESQCAPHRRSFPPASDVNYTTAGCHVYAALKTPRWGCRIPEPFLDRLRPCWRSCFCFCDAGRLCAWHNDSVKNMSFCILLQLLFHRHFHFLASFSPFSSPSPLLHSYSLSSSHHQSIWHLPRAPLLLPVPIPFIMPPLLQHLPVCVCYCRPLSVACPVPLFAVPKRPFITVTHPYTPPCDLAGPTQTQREKHACFLIAGAHYAARIFIK